MGIEFFSSFGGWEKPFVRTKGFGWLDDKVVPRIGQRVARPGRVLACQRVGSPRVVYVQQRDQLCDDSLGRMQDARCKK
jgi:hypothetical protein